ncbi:uncharacterized protein LOC101456386 isoform X2 [Ceratitis capitata]|uniref:uncharacterized protein LOC101456386 isoform X2 n=1 Tax=Ceratitis capitata TaxID=7213 RepID=UPI000A11AF2A|nr:uncharacterized protein LOC101456386 isoform X2 [Ceratitis capitata]
MELKFCIMIISLLLCKTVGVIDKGLKPPGFSIPLPADAVPVISAVLLDCPQKLKNQSESQLMVNIRVNPSFHVEKVEKFLILDELYDIKSRSQAKIMSPYLIEIRRGEPVMMYPLEFSRSLKMNDQNSMPMKDDVSNVDKNVSANKEPVKGHQLEELKQVFTKIVNAVSPSKPTNNNKDESVEVVNVSKNLQGPKVIAGIDHKDSLITTPKHNHLAKTSSIKRNANLMSSSPPFSTVAVDMRFMNQLANVAEMKKKLGDNSDLDVAPPRTIYTRRDGVKRRRHLESNPNDRSDSYTYTFSNNYDIPSKRSKRKRSKQNHIKNIRTEFKIKGNDWLRKQLRRQADCNKNNKCFNEFIGSEEISEVEPNFEHYIDSEQERSLKNLHRYYEGYSDVQNSAKLRNRQSTKYQPKNQIERVIHDPYLNINDKLKLIEIMDPYDMEKDLKLKKSSHEIEDTVLVEPINFAVPLPKEESYLEKSEQNRSSIFHDGLAIRSPPNYNDYAFNEYPLLDFKTRNVEEDVRPCSSCGGKNKKPHGKTDSNVMPRHNGCKCNEFPKECGCASKKLTRSVDDAWYSVYNMSAPLPFLATKVRIFRKRGNIWFKITPSIILNSLSGIFANANLSILFSSHVDVIQLEKGLQIHNHQLLIPKNVGDTFKSEILRSDLIKSSSDCKRAHKSLKPIINLGYFPTTMNSLDQCPSEPSRLCLNMLGSKAPAFSVRLKMPLKQNAIIHPNGIKAKIAKIVTDATIRDVLQISIDVINDSCLKKTFSILISNCGAPCTAAKSKVMKSLSPNIGDTITFLLPLMTDGTRKGGKFECDVLVQFRASETVKHHPLKRKISVNQNNNLYKNTSLENYITAASRKISIETKKRCFCIWECNCHCSTKLETHVDFKICQKMRYEERKMAGMLLGNIYNKGQEDLPYDADSERMIGDKDAIVDFTRNAFILLLIMLLLGLIKALIGCTCSAYVDRYGFDYAQPGKGYEDSSGCRRFVINVFFFVILPFFFWCKCFTPSNLDLLTASTEWKCANLRSNSSSENKSNYHEKNHFDPKRFDEEDDVILTQHIESCSKTNVSSARGNSGIKRISGGNVLCSLKDSRNLMPYTILETTGSQGSDEEENTKYILKTLAESRESLRTLLSTKNALDVTADTDDKLHQAEEFVESLIEAQIVYRKLDRPVGNVKNIPYGIKYCVQGYFLPTTEAGYEFVNYHPLVQYYGIAANGAFMEALRPPVLLNPNDFSRVYKNNLDVLNANDLHVNPPYCVPCINVYCCDFLAIT